MPKAEKPSVKVVAQTSAVDVPAFIATLKHPKTAEILELRAIILATDRTITEGIKWNAPSFATTEHFATFHLRAKDNVQVILHLGAKKRTDAELRESVPDPLAILDWKSADRAVVTFGGLAEIKAKGTAFTAIVREWIKHVR